MPDDGYSPIADYAIIGDCHTAALISTSGSIDWYCPERFDQPAVFCRLLDAEKGGPFSVSPAGQFSPSRSYAGETNVLATRFGCENGGQTLLTDFMPIHGRGRERRGQDVGTSRQVLRLVEARHQPCTVEVRFKPTFNFAQGETELEMASGKGVIARQGDQALVLYCPKLDNPRIENGCFKGELELRSGERAWLALSPARGVAGVYHAINPDVSVRDLERTLDYWQRWSAACTFRGPYRDAIMRSALALKLLIYEPTGAMVAAATTSLPESIGGVRNWDYRYTWLRDASLMLYALSTIGYHDEATDFMEWLTESCGANPNVVPQIMFTVDGKRELDERELTHLEGYRGSKPVRVGNGAANQRQHDIFGDLLNAAYHFRHTIEDAPFPPSPEPHERLSHRNWHVLSALVEEAVRHWQEPDSGIWEIRGERRHYVYSKLMCWVAAERGIRLAREHGLPAPFARWQAARDQICATITEYGFNPEMGAFTQVLGGHELDASVLAMPRFGFLPATDPRMQSTIDAIQRDLTRKGLVERYHAEDGLPPGEGTFALCSFWMVDALAISGRLEEAAELFERMLGYANDVGLLSEEIDPVSSTDRLLGNFPQAFSHTSLISAAVNLAASARHGPEVSKQTDVDRARRAFEDAGLAD